ncbi:37s ribosomal protein rsm22 [Phlyctema vagabunda]|uniref:37s ribosomal protein rsm22 n=1 Tax=Phlyctema vagabunda TaxID=108571 RepID=A0ABR4PAV8_9HELO
MSTSVWPVIPAAELKRQEDISLERELAWLLESLQDTLVSLKSGLEECYALLAPIEPGSTLVMSSPRSESIKGHVTRVGTQIVKGSLHLRLRTHNPLHLVIPPTSSFVLQPLITLRTRLNESLDCVDITRWTGDKKSASFISGQLRLLQSIVSEAKATLKGPDLLAPNAGHDPETTWHTSPPPPEAFEPPLPPAVSLNLTISDASLIMTVRVLESATAVPNLGSRLAFAIGAQRRLEHDEMDEVFMYKGEQVRVKEKLRVESADPSLMAALAKLAALEHTLELARNCLRIVMGNDDAE